MQTAIESLTQAKLELERQLEAINSALEALNGSIAYRDDARRFRTVSRKVQKARKDQGKYLAALRPLNKKARQQVKAVRAKQGVEAAIARARELGAV